MKRQSIKGFTFKTFKHSVELVFINYFLRVVAIYDKDNKKLVKRLER